MKRLSLLILSCAATLHAQTILVRPYVQPGDGSTLQGTDVKVITWLTDQIPASFTVEYSWKGGPPKTAVPVRTALDFAKPVPKPKKPEDSKPAKEGDPQKTTPGTKPAETPKAPATSSSTPPEVRFAAPATPPAAPPKTDRKPSPLDDAATTLDDLKVKVVETFAAIKEVEQHYFRYRAVLPDLPFNTEVTYRVRSGKVLVREGTVKTRATADKSIRFIAVGDMASNKPEQFAVAYQASLHKPDFLIALGDIVYPGGRAIQYMNHFWPCYNDVLTPSPKTGAPLAATIPIYPVIGNHDADMQKMPEFQDAYSAFYWFSVPKNGPGAGPWNVPLGKDARVADAFKAAAGAEYPAMSNYSFDYGPAHFLMLDANSYAMKENDKIFPWIERDLMESKQPWKFVCFHQPAFHTSREHYTEQKMRLLEPLFERAGVNLVFAGHVHNYQRTRPLKFAPNPPKRDSRGRVNGDFTIDNTYDGVKDTTPEGIIHIVTGGGGAKLYSVDLPKTIEYLKKEHGGNYVPITDKYVANKHSFSVIEISPTVFEMKQITLEGVEVDRFRITK